MPIEPETLEDPYCPACNGFGWRKADRGLSAWLWCSRCKGRERRPAVDYPNLGPYPEPMDARS